MRRAGRDVKQHVGAAVKAVGAARWMFLASGLLLAGIVVTVAIEVPINKQVVTWDPQALPENFVAIRERWLQFHVVRTVMGRWVLCVRRWGWRWAVAALSRAVMGRGELVKARRSGGCRGSIAACRL